MSYLTPDNLHIKSADALEDKVKKIVMKISSLKIVTDTFADKINDQFGDFASALKQNADLLDKCKLFDRKNERLDDFYVSALSVEKYPAVFSFIQLVCCLSHGQSSVERGFSINRDTAQHNMKESTFVCRRLIKDHMIAHKQTPATFDLTDGLLVSCSGAHQKYELWRNEEKKKKDASEAEAEVASIGAIIQQLESEQKSFG